MRAALRFCARVLVTGAAWIALSGHVGTNQVVLEGKAGGYPLRVVIRPQGVVPAQVPIIIHVLSGAPTRVTVRAAQWNIGLKGAPPAESAAIVPGEPGTYTHDLWIMTSASYAIYVGVEGPAGNGVLLVPMVSAATRTLSMPGVVGGILVVLGSLLIIGVLTIVGAASREATLPVGFAPDSSRRKSARVATGISAAVLALALLGGAKWWQSAESRYKRGLYRPFTVTSSVRMQDTLRLLTLVVTDQQWERGRTTPITPDHGRLMHLFLIRASDAGAIAHLHPLRTAFNTFQSAVPALPAGKYFLFADVLHESGFQRTLVDTVDVPGGAAIANGTGRQSSSPIRTATSAAGAAASTAAGAGEVANANANANARFIDANDAWRVVQPTAVGSPAPIENGAIVLSLDGPAIVNRDVSLHVNVSNADGIPATLEPYMGMGGHLMVMREDGGVFVHLHPGGTASMTAQALLMRRERGDTGKAFSDTTQQTDVAGMQDMPSGMAPMQTGTITFPFAFPTEGKYRVFVQVKRKGAVQTAAFALTVQK